jgi:hypothetical protein
MLSNPKGTPYYIIYGEKPCENTYLCWRYAAQLAQEKSVQFVVECLSQIILLCKAGLRMIVIIVKASTFLACKMNLRRSAVHFTS